MSICFGDAAPRAHERVLVADDDLDSRHIVSEMLRSGGYEVIETADVSDALSVVARGACDAVVLDLWTPPAAGRRVVAAVRERLGRHVPVVGLTTWALGAPLEEISTAGCDDLLVKPLLPTTVLATVRRALDTRVPRSVDR